MAELFLTVLNRSISAGWLVLLAAALRFLLKKAPKWTNVLLWGLVAVRLICPITLESALSLIPSAQTVSPEIMLSPSPAIHSGIEAVNRVVNPVIRESFTPNPAASANPLQILIPIASLVWLAGMLLMGLYTLASFWRLRFLVRGAVRIREDVYQGGNVPAPFVLGILKPRIYLPDNMTEPDIYHVIAHEHTHIRRRDHWWKPLGFLLLTVYWFNPLMWLAYILLCRDIELACDEQVVKTMRPDQRADYSQALLNCSAGRAHVAACPLAFGEVGVKERVKNVLRYRKPAFWAVAAALAAVAVTAVCFLTNPKTTVLPFMEADTPVTRAEVRDNRSGESRSLSGEEREKLSTRLRDLKGLKKTDTLAEYAPEYELTAHLEGLGELDFYGPPEGEEAPLLFYGGSYYALRDPAFTAYLEGVCAGASTRLTGQTFYAVELLYDDPRLSSVWSLDKREPYCMVPRSDSGMPHLLVRNVNPLFPGDGEAGWTDCGALEKVELTEENFDRLIYDFDAAGVRRENAFAYRTNPEELDGEVFFYLLLQKNGDIFLTYGSGGDYIRSLVRLAAPGEAIPAQEAVAMETTQPTPGDTGLPAEGLSPEDAAAEGWVVMVDGDVWANKRVWERFTAAASRREPVSVRIVTYYSLPSPEGYDPAYYETIKDSYPETIVQDLTFDGREYTLRWWEDGQEKAKTYRHMHYFAELAENPGQPYDVCKQYVLMEDPSASYEELMAGLPSSQWGAGAEFYVIYRDLIDYVDHLEVPVLQKAVLELDGQELLAVTDPDALQKLREMFTGAEALGYEPKTYGLGPALVMTGEDGTQVTAWLIYEKDLCLVEETFFDYGPGFTQEGGINATQDLWAILGINGWPEADYGR